MPLVERLRLASVFPVFQDIPHHIAEIPVAGHHYGILEVKRGAVGVASQLVFSEIVSLVAGICVFRLEYSFLKANEAVHEFEHRARRVWSLHGAVEHRLVRVADNFLVMLADVRQHLDVDSRAGNHRQNLPGGRLYGYQAAYLVLHQELAVLLQIGVDGGHNVLAGDGFLVHLAVLVPGLYLVVGIPQIDVIAFFALQVGFPCRLQAGLAGIVSGPVFARMPADVGLVHLGYVAEKIASCIERIVPDAPDLSPETRKLVLDFGELHIFLGGELLHHYDGLVADSPPVLPVFGHLASDEVRFHFQNAGEQEGVEFRDFLGRHENVVGHFVADYDLSVPVIDHASGRVDDVIHHRVVGCVDLVAVVDDLYIENLGDENSRHYEKTDSKLVGPFKFHLIFLRKGPEPWPPAMRSALRVSASIRI